MCGLSPDGGLFVPSKVDALSADEIKSWSTLSFPDLAAKVMSKFIGESDIPTADLQKLMNSSYKGVFSTDEVTPLHELGELSLLEQFHGPTCAFKDVALQFVGNLFEYFLQRKNASKQAGEEPDFITVLGATSGDTGSAAIYGLRGKKDVTVCILHPKGKVAKVQELQMTTVMDENVSNVAIEGNFDDCQAIVKKLFKQQQEDEVLAGLHLGAVNSINWARILAQIVYYFSGYFQWLKRDQSRQYGDKVSFVVPTGNFGNALAGYYARRLGLPIGKLVIATNSNNILHRFIADGDFSKKPCVPTLAPAMDITIPSNFERYLYELSNCSGKVTGQWMESSQTIGDIDLSVEGSTEERLASMREIFSSCDANDEQIEAAVKSHADKYAYTHCPHTACAIHGVENVLEQGPNYIVMATAHHGKFGIDLAEAEKMKPELPQQLQHVAVEGKPTRCEQLPNDSEKVREFLLKKKELQGSSGSSRACGNECCVVT